MEVGDVKSATGLLQVRRGRYSITAFGVMAFTVLHGDFSRLSLLAAAGISMVFTRQLALTGMSADVYVVSMKLITVRPAW